MSASPNIIPIPVSCRLTGGAPFALTALTVVTASDPALRATAAQLAVRLDVAVLDRAPAGVPVIALEIDSELTGRLGAEGYVLTTGAAGVSIRGGGAAGVFYGTQSLRQLLPPDIERFGWRAGGGGATVPAVEIEDRPRFRWRGSLLDVSRHFSPVGEVKQYLDTLALHKLNVFHWHLVDDQGWRIEIKKYPRLTEVGAWRAESPRSGSRDLGDGERYGGFYTQEEIRSVVAYAAEREITVVPEIELPGHAAAAIAAYPEFGNADVEDYAPEVPTRWGIHRYTYAPREETFRFLEDVFTEVLALFPSTYIHVGGDEAPKNQWEQSKAAQEVMQREGLADEHALQSWFIRRIERFLTARGRRLIGWDEIQEGGLSPTATMMVWRDWEWARHALMNGNQIVMSPLTHCYLDFYQADPASSPEPEAFNNLLVMCSKTNAWVDYFHADPKTRPEPRAVPRILALEQVYSLDPVPPDLDPAKEKLVLGVQGNLWTEYIHDFPSLGYMAFPRLSALAEVGWTPVSGKNYESFCLRIVAMLRRLKALGLTYRDPVAGRTDR